MDSEECCRNGCNTCVLDKKYPKKELNLCKNVIEHRYKWTTVTDINRQTENVFILQFKFSDNIDPDRCLSVPPGAHLMMRLPSDCIRKDMGCEFAKTDMSFHRHKENYTDAKRATTNDTETTMEYFSRPYSPFSYNSEDLMFRILFRYEGGEMSQRIIRLNVGDIVEWKGFYSGAFKYSRNMCENLICISQGVALAPMVNIINSVLDDDLDETRIHLMACFRDFPDVLLRDSLREYLNFWNFKLSLFLPHHLTNGSCKSPPCNCKETKKMYSEDIYFEKISSTTFKPTPDSIYLISGSETFMKSMTELLEGLKINLSNIFTL